MTTVVAPSTTAYLDILLDELCVALQLTPTQYESAEEKYRAVADWLSAPGSPLARLQPRIYPQGSVALQTTVKPRRDQEQEEFDVDSVLESADWSGGPMALYDAVYRRLDEHNFYSKILEPKKRCVRLNYAGEFHLDVLSAVTDWERGGSCIQIPDCELQDWTQSNPRGFVEWFNGRARPAALPPHKRLAADPLPDNDPPRRRPPLKRAVQLLKRRRDVVFNGSDLAPRSVVLTTLAGQHYRGQSGVTETLLDVLDGIAHQIENSAGIFLVLNPTNPEECFSDAWDDRSYQAFTQFVFGFRDELRRVTECSGLPDLKILLTTLFGDEPTKRAMKALTARVEGPRERQALGIKPGVGLAAVSTGARPIPRNTFHGSS